ncbi:unnamed protein product [Rangifer tarandus platyrhynchus]|uniref:Uncharacterized protein n=1 Tax=Rangifer tarandus platyrhynchus TaxID=3082113 RepID=A0ABN8XKK4_RANTA|nr:unnamed protein product [Rangifer tarandus platyrhynchus]
MQSVAKELVKRRSTAVSFLIAKVMEVDIRCPLEAVKRFASPRRQLQFYAARGDAEKQVVHHPPGDRLRREKDVIIWDDKGYAKVAHVSADKKTTSITQLGSFWVRHQSKAQQHSSRPLVLLSTQFLPGQSITVEDKEQEEEDEDIEEDGWEREGKEERGGGRDKAADVFSASQISLRNTLLIIIAAVFFFFFPKTQ